MRIYLDTCALQRPLDDLSQLRVRVEADAVAAVLAAVENGELVLVGSDVLRFETENNPGRVRREFARRILRRATVDVPTSEAVVARAERFEQAGLRPLDAVHLASAIEARAAFFCTTDSALLRRSRRVNTEPTRVVSPLDLVAALDP